MATLSIDIPPYTPHPVTQYALDYAPLAFIDLSTFDHSTEDRARLALQLKDAVHNTGFWVVTGHGITDGEINRQLAIGQAFYKRPLEDKREYPCNFAQGSYMGYREPVRYIADTNVKENHEALNIAKFDSTGCRHPLHSFFVPFESEIASFQKKLWELVLRKLLVLTAIALELPDDYFVAMHEYSRPSEDHLCYKLYHHRTAQEWEAIKEKFRPGHTDFGTLTLVFSQTQTVSGLQIRTPQGEWKHIKSVPDGITVNAGDTFAMLTKGYLKSTVHAVHRPPPDQEHFDRLSLLYFLRIADDVDVVPAPSPLLKRIGWLTDADMTSSEHLVQGIEWIRARVKAYNHRQTIESTNEPAHFTYQELQVQVQYD